MCTENEGERTGKGHHFGREHDIVTGPADDHHSRIVDDAGRAATGQEGNGFEQELRRLDHALAHRSRRALILGEPVRQLPRREWRRVQSRE